MRMIDADALTEKCGDWYVEEGTEEGFIGTLGQLLSEQPETNCSEFPNNSDTISRQAAIDAVEKNACNTQRIMDAVNNLPSVQLERKTGQWLPDTTNYYEERFVCSVCRRSYKVDTCMGKPMWDFCPCGADMRGKQE